METLQKNMEFIRKLSGKEMIRMGRHISIEEATSKAKEYTVGNITEMLEKQQDEADIYTVGNITDKITEQLGREYNNIQYKDKSLKNTTKEIEFLSYNYTINQITLAGGFLFELDSYELIEKKNWWGTVFAAVIGVISIYTGLGIIGTWGLGAGAAGTVFATAFGASLVLQGVGDILGSLISVATGNPINFGDFINSKGMAIGVALATAGTLHFLSGIEVIDAALKITEKMSDLQALYNVGRGAFVLGAIGTQVALAGTSALVYNILKHTVDSDDIEQDAKEAANKLLNDKKEALKKIFATDQFFENVGDQSRRGYLENLLDEEVIAITGNYLGRFHGDKETFGMDYAVGMAGHAVGGKYGDGVFGWANVISTGAKALQGVVKSSEAIGKIISKVRSAIDRIADMALSPSDIMLFNLQKARGGATDDDANSLKYALERQGFISDGNIKVSCVGDNGIGSVQVASNLASYKNMLVSACLSTKKLMSISFEDKFNELKSKLISQITDTKTNIQKHEVVKPVAHGISTPLVEKMKESNFYKRLFNGIADKMDIYVPSEAETKQEAINIAKAHGVLHSALKQHAIAEGKQADEIAVDRNPIDSQKTIDESKIKDKFVLNPRGKEIPVKDGDNLWDIWEREGKPLGISWSKFQKDNAHIEQKYGTLHEMHKGDVVYADTNRINSKPNQKTHISKPTNIKSSGDSKFVFTNTCPANQDTCAHPAVLTASYEGGSDYIDSITALDLIEEEHTKNLENEINQNLNKKFLNIINEADHQLSQTEKRWLSNKESGILGKIDNFIGIGGEGADKVYIYSKAIARTYVLLGEEKFAKYFPEVYMWFGGKLENIVQFIGEKVSAGDNKLYKLFGEKYVTFKGEVSSFAKEFDNNAPEPVQDFVKLATFGAIGKGAAIVGEKVVAGSVVVGGKLKDGVKKVFTKPDTTHHKTHTDTGGHNVDHDIKALNKQEKMNPVVTEPINNVPENVVSKEAHLVDLRASMSKPHVENQELKEIVGNLYKPNAKVGSGSTAAALREELATGKLVGGKSHDMKAEQHTIALKKWIKSNPTASPGDRAAAENILKDLHNALNGGKDGK